MKRILIVLLCILLMTGGTFMIISVLRDQKFANDELQSCLVSTGGGMRGGRSEMRLKKDENGGIVYAFSEKEAHADRLVTTTYKADAEALAHVSELVARHHLYRASKRPYSKIRALDAATTTISFDYAKDSFSVSEEQVMSANMSEGFREVIAFLSSLAVGDGVKTKEPQNAVLYLKSGYTLQFTVENEFDGRLDAILGEEHEVSAFKNSGIVLAAGEAPNLSSAVPVKTAAAGTIVYSPQDNCIVLLYADESFPKAFVLARLKGYVPSAAPLIAEMQGEYGLKLN